MSHHTAHQLLAGALPPGVESIAREDGAMTVRFADATEVTVVRSFLAGMGDVTFELWLPSEMMPRLTQQEVIDRLRRMAEECVKRGK